jgi:hypothetical protein
MTNEEIIGGVQSRTKECNKRMLVDARLGGLLRSGKQGLNDSGEVNLIQR